MSENKYYRIFQELRYSRENGSMGHSCGDTPINCVCSHRVIILLESSETASASLSESATAGTSSSSGSSSNGAVEKIKSLKTLKRFTGHKAWCIASLTGMGWWA